MKLLFGIVLVAHASSAPVKLERVAKVDDRAIYAMKGLIDLGGKDDVRFTGSFTEKVKSVDADKIVTAVESKVSVDVMGVVRQGRMVASDREEATNGTLLKPSLNDTTLLFGVGRIDRLRAVYFPKGPIEIGAAWWHLGARDDELKGAPFADYLKLEGEETLGTRKTWRISLDAQEVDDPAAVHVKGMVWIDQSNGSLVRGQWTINGFVYNATSPPLTARYELSRVD